MVTQNELKLWREGKLDFHCNECHTLLRDNIKTIDGGIFCQKCYDKIIAELQNIIGKGNLYQIQDREENLPP